MTSHPKPFRQSFKDLARLLPAVLRDAWPVLLTVHVGRTISSELFSYSAQAIQARGKEDLASLATAVALQFVFEMAWSSVWAFIAIRITRAHIDSSAHISRSVKEDFKYLVIEGIRVMSAVLYRIPLLIIPALVEIVRLTFVPHVVLLDPAYHRGEVDALEASRTLTKGRFSALVGAWAVYLVLSTLPSLSHGAMSLWFWERPLGFALESFVTLFINVGFEVFLVALFLRLSQHDNLVKGNTDAHL
jgi:hypothetical protein